MNFDNELTYRNKRNGAVVYGGVPPKSPDEWEHVYVIPANDAILAVRPSGVPEAAVEAGVEAARQRLTWPSLHWGECRIDPEAWPHVVRAALTAALPLLTAAPSATREEVCLCNVGVQECPTHPGRLLSKDERIAFRKAWDDRAVAGGAS